VDGGGGNQGGVNDRALPQQQAFLGQQRRRFIEQRLCQLMTFQQTPEFEDRRLVRHRLFSGIKPCKLA